MSGLTTDKVWKLLDEVKDPEIPVVSVVEMGIVRQVAVDGKTVHIRMTPTFAGCPALQVMQKEMERHLLQAGADQVEIKVSLSPAWSTEWITSLARQKLKAFGLGPPPHHSGDFESVLLDEVACPYCDSVNTTLKNSFGPTLCRAIYYCNDCQQPFEQFKPV